MKKLMIAAAIVCAAVVSQGSAVQWKSSNMSSHTGVGTKDAMTMYVWEIEKTAYDTLLAKSTDAEALSQYIAANYDTSKATIEKNNTKVSGTKGAMTMTGADDKTVGQQVWAAVLIVDNDDGYVMGNLYTGKVPEGGDLVASNLGLNIGGDTSAAATAWAAVPEPTSGLLLLLGVAGLALRRRRA